MLEFQHQNPEKSSKTDSNPIFRQNYCFYLPLDWKISSPNPKFARILSLKSQFCHPQISTLGSFNIRHRWFSPWVKLLLSTHIHVFCCRHHFYVNKNWKCRIILNSAFWRFFASLLGLKLFICQVWHQWLIVTNPHQPVNAL